MNNQAGHATVNPTTSSVEAHYRQQVRERRRKALDILMAGSVLCVVILLIMLAWIISQPREPLRDPRYLAFAATMILGSVTVSYALARWMSHEVASVVLLVSGIVIITFSDNPADLANGPALIAYAVPILAAGILLPAWSTFALAGLASASLLAASMLAPSLLVAVPSVLVFFMLALITWYFAHTLEQSNRALSDANAELTKDIAERKRTEADLRLMSHVVEQSPISIALMNIDGQLVYVNRRFLQMTGHSLEEAKGLTWSDMQPSEAGPETDAAIFATLAAGREWRAQTKRVRTTGEEFWEAVSISLVHDAGGDTEHYLAMAEDVTARQEAENTLRNINSELERRVEERTAELLRANVALERSARLKDEFLATMSHELRTPLTGILGAADVLNEQVNGALNTRQLRSVQSIVGSGQHLLALINGILDLSKIEAGGMKVEPQPLDVDHACKNALTVIREQSAQKMQTISFTSRPANMQLDADPIRLKQMLANLLSNAVKFTPDGGRIGLDVVGDADNNKIHFTVWDTGIGIQAEEMPRLFEPFVQLDSGLKRKYGGTGLGLTLVRKFAEMHGGGVSVESSPGEGSKFTISLPWGGLGALEPKTDAAERRPVVVSPCKFKDGRKPLILLAEDSQPSIETVLSFLEPLGCDVHVVQRGDEAVQYTVEQRPDLVLMDIQMPYLDGVAAIRQIRAHANPSVAATPIIALTALAMRGDRERCLAAGADEYLSKPFTLRAFTQMVCDLLSRSEAVE